MVSAPSRQDTDSIVNLRWQICSYVGGRGGGRERERKLNVQLYLQKLRIFYYIDCSSRNPCTFRCFTREATYNFPGIFTFYVIRYIQNNFTVLWFYQSANLCGCTPYPDGRPRHDHYSTAIQSFTLTELSFRNMELLLTSYRPVFLSASTHALLSMHTSRGKNT
jgi:hypothetical protein